MGKAKFIEEDHTYVTPGGRVLPGITSLLRSVGILDKMRGSQRAMARGSRVHEAIQFDCEGDLNLESMSAAEVGYVHGARRARDEGGIEVSHAELAVCNEALGYGTKLDAIGTWKGMAAVVNWKTGGMYDHYPIQMALEALCCGHLWKIPATQIARLGVFVRSDGRHSIHQYEDVSDITVARAIATTVSWKRRQE